MELLQSPSLLSVLVHPEEVILGGGREIRRKTSANVINFHPLENLKFLPLRHSPVFSLMSFQHRNIKMDNHNTKVLFFILCLSM